MLTLLFFVLLFSVFGKVIGLAFRATWGIAKVFFSLIFLPVFLILLVGAGFIYLAIPILLVVGFLSLVAD